MLPAETQAITIPPEHHPRDLLPPDSDPDSLNASALPFLPQPKVVRAHFKRVSRSLRAVAMDGLLKADPSVFSDRAKLQLLQSCQPGAKYWLDYWTHWRATPPRHAWARYALALWLGDDIPELADTADPSGRHILHEANKTSRHDWLVRVLKDVIIEAGGSAWGGTACSIFGDGRRVDLIAKLKRADTLYALDPTIVDGSTDACISAGDAFTAVTGGVQVAESKKREHYHDCPATHELTPFAVGHQIELGISARVFVTTLAAEVAFKSASGSEPSQGAINRAARHIMQRIGCSVMCNNARIIDDAIMRGDGLPGHTSKNRAVHSTWERGECVYPARFGG